ncbi:hypothetical protein MSG28_002726 [Choristoneura fumiferana]|uniref:Uncharacterized protein n=1 Tax=Choristoneura fumiferana TaxID=7141 RepID=A0ACC0JJ25_CHOFU|nr:hypothetical protein MSG28_002726 [Choristoneura fumiferana]
MAAGMAAHAQELRPQHSRDSSRDSGIFHTTKGLWNAPGLNNCFLNSAVQVSMDDGDCFPSGDPQARFPPLI